MSEFSLLSVIGIEIEYMLVDRTTLNVVPCSDVILKALAGEPVNEVELGNIAISNELVMHVLELKNNGPKPPNASIVEDFQQTIKQLQPLLAQHNVQLLPSGAHPWMNPLTETKRWPYGNNDIYHQYDKIFNCQGHGWANLQSMHVNLPFDSDEDFNYLYNSIRLLLPILPALAASTPFLEGRRTGLLDSRLDFYGKNQQRIPSISGHIIPESIRSQAHYEQDVLAPMYRDIAPYDPDGILQNPWLDSRAAIAKFDVKAVEIRIIDSQECVNADIAIALVIHAILTHWQTHLEAIIDKPCDTQRLKALYGQTIKDGLSTLIEDKEILHHWQLPLRSMTARDAWSMLIERVAQDLDQNSQRTLEYILSQGSLSERLLRAAGQNDSQEILRRLYRNVSECLIANQMFSVL